MGSPSAPCYDGAIRYTDIQGVRVPSFIYGTAWKEDETARLVRLALDTGFRGIDTANQRRHYHEAGVRPEPLLRRDRLGSRGAHLLPRAWGHLPGVLAPHRQP